MATPKLRSRAHIHINKFISLSLPLDEIFDGVAAIGRRALVALAHPARDRKIPTRIAVEVTDQCAVDERDTQLRTTEQTLVHLGYDKKQARAAVDQIRDQAIGKPSHEVVTMALRACRPPEGTEVVQADAVKTSKAPVE